MRTVLLGALGLAAMVAAAAKPPPVTAFTNFAQVETAAISPAGTYLAITQRSARGEILNVVTLPDLKPASRSSFGEQTGIERLEWANDHRVLLQPVRSFVGLTPNKTPTGQILGIDADGKNPATLFGYATGQQQTGTRQRESIDAPARMLATLPEDPQSVLIESYGYGIKGEFNSVYRMDVSSGLLTHIAISPIRNGTFLTDMSHRVVFVSGEDPDGNYATYYRPPTGGDWKLIASGDSISGWMMPVGPWGASGEFLVLDNRDAPTTGVFVYSPADGGSKLLFRKPEVDISGAYTDAAGKPWVFTYEDPDPGYWYPDPQHPLAEVHQWLTATFKGYRVDIDSSTSDMSYVVAQLSAPRAPLVFLYVDAKNKKVLQFIPARPDLKPQDLAEVEAIEFRARDGLLVRGFLTVPNVAKKEHLPMIVLVHGGPHGVFDVYGFDYEAQLFASRGYAVLQVNYRGSGGRGRLFEAAGYGKWGAEMQDDVTDAVRWAIGNDIADSKRICIYGGSYGAYSALAGAFREPEMFQCAVGLAGVYDLPLMFTSGDTHTLTAHVNYLKKTLGTDEEDLKRRSPVYNADKIHAAVMLLHGKDDARAPIEHAERMRDALKKAGNAPKWMVESGEGHGFLDEGDRAEAFKNILDFFAKHLGSANSAVKGRH